MQVLQQRHQIHEAEFAGHLRQLFRQRAFVELLPRISYLTRADRFTLSSLILVFLALAEAVATSALSRHGRAEAGNRLDRYSRVAFPAALAVIIAFSFMV